MYVWFKVDVIVCERPRWSVFSRRHVKLGASRGEHCRFMRVLRFGSHSQQLSILSFGAILPPCAPSLTLMAPCFHFPWPRSQALPRQESIKATTEDCTKPQAKLPTWSSFFLFASRIFNLSQLLLNSSCLEMQLKTSFRQLVAQCVFFNNLFII